MKENAVKTMPKMTDVMHKPCRSQVVSPGIVRPNPVGYPFLLEKPVSP